MKLRNALLALLLVALTFGSADARRNRKIGGKRYVANGTFGAGLELGAPFGLNGKYFLKDDGALNFGVGLIDYYYDGRDGLNLYLDYLWHPVSLANPPAFQLPLYVGIGGRLWSFDDNRDGLVDNDAFAFGIRVPVGIAFDLNNTPLDIFIQLTFVLDFYARYANDVDAHLEGSVGIRYWFN